MRVNSNDINASSGFYIVDKGVYEQTLAESKIEEWWYLGGVTISHGLRNGEPVWMLDNPDGKCAIWLEVVH